MARHRLALATALFAILLLAFGLRLYRLGQADVWWDEGFSVWLARFDPVSIAQMTVVDEHPPLHYWLLSLWARLAGETEVAVRFSSLFFGVLSIALLYRLGASLLGTAGGLSAAALLAVSRFHVWWSQEIKMYALAIFLSLLGLWFFVGLVRRPSRTAWIGHVAAMTLALYTL
ncbi:MAG: glycosyltransferase family 39 protein, partial [Chloroflexi bacterium]|nr:glycosyltransferase family 39 protein [Chloroflexota bacterium]